jgi:DNA-binding IclR family transcriptional regulator
VHVTTRPFLLKQELQSIRSQGFAFCDGEVDIEATAISTSLSVHRGKVMTGITVAIDRKRINNLIKKDTDSTVKDNAKKASDDCAHFKSK